MVVCKDRTAETLCGLIQKYVKTGTKIYTDCWSSYHGLTELGYEVNLRVCLLNPLNPLSDGGGIPS